MLNSEAKISHVNNFFDKETHKPFMCNSCNIDMRALPDMYARGQRAYTSGKARMPVLQLICNIFTPQIKETTLSTFRMQPS